MNESEKCKAADDDFMCQEQYVLELPDELAQKAENPDFEFDLVFDNSGTSGNFVVQGNDSQYIFRCFYLPLVTESYTSADGDIFFKNADISQIIVVYDPSKPPKLLADYQTLQEIMLYKIEHGGFPVSECSPHGLTAASRWAPLKLYPQFPIRPKWCKEPPVFPTNLVSSAGQQGGDAIKQDKKRLKDLRIYSEAMRCEIARMLLNYQMQQRDGNVVDTSALDLKKAQKEEIDREINEIDERLKQKK